MPKAFHYTNKVFQTIVNIILIFAAEYSIVKGVAKLTKFAGTSGKLGKLKTVFKGTKSGFVKGGKAIASLITKPRKVLSYSKTRINKMMYAAADEGYFMYLRNLPMKYIAKERAFWKKYHSGWKKSATKQEVAANELEKSYTNAESQTDPLKAEKMAKEANQKTGELNKETHHQLEEIKNGTVPNLKPQNKFLPENFEITYKKGVYIFKDNIVNKEIGMMEINNGYVTFAIYRKGVPTQVKGRQVFDSFMEHLKIEGINYRGIKGIWGVESDNTKLFNEAVGQNKSLESAAFNTWTGDLVAKHGLKKVQIDFVYPKKPPYTKIEVTFTK